jgi:hypothetical protein
VVWVWVWSGVESLEETKRTGHTNELLWTVRVGHVGRGEDRGIEEEKEMVSEW